MGLLPALLLVGLVLQAGTPPPAPAVEQADNAALQGEWNVEIIHNIKVMPDSRVTLSFQGNRVAGLASSNTYQGNAAVTGTALKVSGILATMKYCDAPRMSQEKDFLDLLRTATRYELRPDGALVIFNAAGKSMTARRTTSLSMSRN
jgi:heat shock protein HslJ